MAFLLTLSYDGTDFNGWQSQGKDNLRTVQEVMEQAAEKVFSKPVKITASGRTDAGVHALGQTCSFSVDTTIPAKKMPECFNAYLPKDVRVLEGVEVAEDFCACRSAKKKTYVYSVYTARRANPLLERYAVQYNDPFDAELLQKAAKVVEGEHDFKAFCASNSSAKTTVRTIYEVKVVSEKTIYGEVLRFHITGNGFLYNMVRTLVGTFLDIASGRKTLSNLNTALVLGDRKKVGRTMPAKGLCLYLVEYL